MNTTSTHTSGDQRIGRVLIEDIRRGGFLRTVRREFRDLKDFMLTEERQKRLKQMGRVKQWLFISWWLLESLVLKLTPTRRLLLIIGIVLVLLTRTIQIQGHNVQIQNDTTVLGALVVLFVLMLELKDKLLAQSELEGGRAVQKALMPETSPQVPGWSLWLFMRSANEVGGDLVDFVRISDTRIGIALGDVAGKGLRAALLTAKLQSTIRALAPDFSSLADLGKKLNQIFCRDSIPNIFASVVYLELQPNAGLVRLLNAGHFPPIIVRETRIDKLEKGGAALGILPSPVFNEQAVELGKDSLLLVYSDGLTEARNEAGEYFGEQRLLELLPRLATRSTKEIGERILAEVDRFIEEARLNDDLSIALLKRV